MGLGFLVVVCWFPILTELLNFISVLISPPPSITTDDFLLLFWEIIRRDFRRNRIVRIFFMFVFSLWFLFRWSLLVSCFIVFVCSLLELLMVLMGILLLVRLWNLFYLRIDFFASFIWQLDSLFAMIASIFSSFYSDHFSF